MSRLGGQLTDSNAEPNSKRVQSLMDVVNQARIREDNNEREADVDYSNRKVQSWENSGNMAKATPDTYLLGEEVPVTGNIDGDYAFSSNYSINIEPLTSGFIVKVGCQTLAVEEGSDVAKLLQIYLSGDKSIGTKWMRSEKNVQKFIKEHLQVK